MPIGFNRGDTGGSSRQSSATRPRSETTRPSSFPQPPAVADRTPTRLREFSAQRTVWMRWITASDERTCPECAPLEGTLWREGEGPEPPLHGNCRCTRVTAFVEVGSRS